MSDERLEQLAGNTLSAIDELDKNLRANPETNKRVLVVTDDQYHTLGGLTNDTYDTRTGVLFRLLEHRIRSDIDGAQPLSE